MSGEHPEADLCGIDGDPQQNVTVAMFNRFARRTMTGHVQPLKIQVAEQGKKIDELSTTINDWLTRLDASLKTVKYMIIMVCFILAVAVWAANYPGDAVNIMRLIGK